MLKKFQSLDRTFYRRAAAVLGAVVISDFIWAKYMFAISTSDALGAASWAVCVIALGAYLVVSYVEDKRLVLPACIGAFIGTYLGLL